MSSTAELVTEAIAGSKPAFGQLVRLYERASILMAYAILHDYHTAQDVSQDAFLSAYGNLRQLRDHSAFGPWLLQIVRRKALQAKSTNRPEPLGADVVAADAGRQSDWIEKYDDVIEQLTRLAEHDQMVIVLRYVDGRSVQEIAEITGKPFETLRKQLFRAVQRLRTFLQRKVLS